MPILDRYRVSILEEAKAGIFSLFKQVAGVSVGFLLMLLLTKGSPPKEIVGCSFGLAFVFVVFQERKRLIRLYSMSSDMVENNPSEDDHSSQINKFVKYSWTYIRASQILDLNREDILREACTSAFNKYHDLGVSSKDRDIFYKSLEIYLSKFQVRLKGSGQVKFDDWDFEMKPSLLLQGYVVAFTRIRELVCNSTDESIEEVPRQILDHHLSRLVEHLLSVIEQVKSYNTNY